LTQTYADHTGTRPGEQLAVEEAVGRRLTDVLGEERRRWLATAVEKGDCAALLGVLERTLVGGKRVRAQLCLWGYAGAARRSVGTGATEPPAGAVDAAAAVELLHAFAVIHDDVMDGSPIRRGDPSVHERFRAEHGTRGWAGDGRRFGDSMAILAGDLAFALAQRLAAGLPAPSVRVWTELIRDLTVGQYLDVIGAARGRRDAEYAGRVARLKSGSYTVERPLQLGAAVAGRLDELAPAYTAYGRPLGEAFQLRDDLLGAFGDPAVTGKPAGEDLRDGKSTLLLAYADGVCTGPDRWLLDKAGRAELDDAELAALVAMLERCGAREMVERRITGLVDQATAALDAALLPPDVIDALHRFAISLAWRRR
jgi:geranylgeranyl diphosphate synthase type I